MAWLSATPRSEKPKALQDRSADEAKSRLAAMREDGIEPDMPPLPSEWYFDTFMQIGPAESGAMGSAQISWREINEWCFRNGVSLSPWEARLMRHLSRCWLDESREATKPSRPSPWGTKVNENNREVVARKAAALFGGLARAG